MHIPQITRRRILAGLGASTTATFAVGGYALAVEPMWRLNVTRYSVSPKNWPEGSGAQDCRHRGSARRRAFDALRAYSSHCCRDTNALSPDIVVLLGDFAASHRFRGKPVPPQEWADALSALRAPLGVHAVLGNHDWWDDVAAQRAGKGPVIGRACFGARGHSGLRERRSPPEKERPGLLACGLGRSTGTLRQEQASSRRRFRGVHNLPGTLARVKDDAPVILLAHEPDIFVHVPDRVALTLSGHTHGGQVRLFGYSPVVPSRYGNRFAYGHVVEDDRHLIVSGGLGCSMLPVRLGVPPEIVLVDVAAATV